MNNRRNYYRILHVQPDAPTQVIRASYRTMMQRMKMHPDLGGDGETATLINEAWAVLRDERARARYDRGRAQMDRERGSDAPQDDAPDNPSAADPRPGSGTAASAATRCHFCGLRHGPTASLDSADECGRCGSPLFPAEKSSSGDDAQRAIHRLDRRERLTFFTGGDSTKTFCGQTRDMSPHGIKFVTDQPPAVGDVIKLVTPVCQATARVVNVRRSPGPHATRWHVGVNFLTLRFERSTGAFVSATV